VPGLHTEFACLLYGMLQNKLPEDVVHGIVRGAVDAERKFICEALPCDLIGMNSELMTKCHPRALYVVVSVLQTARAWSGKCKIRKQYAQPFCQSFQISKHTTHAEVIAPAAPVLLFLCLGNVLFFVFGEI
jgi:hypothetical protein